MAERNNINRYLWIFAIAIIAVLIIGVGYFVSTQINKPSDMTGMWNGTIQYQKTYYESRFVFYDNGSAEMWLFPKPNMTFNYTQIRTEAVAHDKMTWAQVNTGSYDLTYSDGGKVRLDYPNIPQALRFNETIAEPGYRTPYVGYISKNYDNITDFGVLNTR